MLEVAGVHVAGLAAQGGLGQIGQVEVDGDRQTREQQQDHERHRAAAPRNKGGPNTADQAELARRDLSPGLAVCEPLQFFAQRLLL